MLRKERKSNDKKCLIKIRGRRKEEEKQEKPHKGNKFKMDHRSKYKTQNYKTPRR